MRDEDYTDSYIDSEFMSDSESISSSSEYDSESPEDIEEKIKNYLPVILLNKDISWDNNPKGTKRKYEEIDDTTQKLIKEIRSISISEKNNLLKKLVLSNLNIDIKKNLLDMYEETSQDKLKYHKYIHRVLRLPTNEFSSIKCNETKIPEFMTNLRNKLDDSISGHVETKEEIIDYISSLMRNPKANSNILALQSAPGMGKTRFIRALGKALNLPFNQISFGGLNDPSILTGHEFTYLGSKPGKIYDILVKSKCMNGIIMLDEIDKIGDIDSPKTKEVTGILTHMLDKEQNTEFIDNYLGIDIPIDLSKILFIATFNNEHNIDPILLNRMKVIKIKESTLKEKIEIVQKFTIPEVVCNNNLQKFNIVISPDIIKYIILSKTTHEPGMRNINKNIRTIYNKINTLLFLEKTTKEQRNMIAKGLSYENIKLQKNDDNSIVIDIGLIDKLLRQSQKSTYINMMYN